MLGYKDDELTARWTQYGIFSPIMRLHSSCSEFNGKEPWRFKKETEEAMEAALRQRQVPREQRQEEAPVVQGSTRIRWYGRRERMLHP